MFKRKRYTAIRSVRENRVSERNEVQSTQSMLDKKKDWNRKRKENKIVTVFYSSDPPNFHYS